MGKPEIRFKGYTDEWEQRKLSELSEKTFGGGTPKTSNESFWKGNIPWIQSSDLIEGSLFDVEPRKYISQEAVDKSATKLVPENSVAIVTRVGVGKLAFMPFSYATSQDFLSLSVLKTEPQFTVYALYKKLQSELNAVQGTSIKGVTKDELLAKEVMIPCYKEQEKIGSYLHSLDHLITLHQHKCELYQQSKQSMMEKLFTQSICFTSENGNEFPKWIEKTLQDLENENKITLNRGNIIPKSEGKYPVYSASTKNNGLMCYSDKYMFDEELITWSIDGGGDFFYRPKHKFSITNVSGYIKIIDQNYLIYKYLAYQLQYLHNFLRFDYLSKAHPSVIRELYTVHIPYLEEQIKIANILSKYDELIAISKNQLNTLQTLKKGLLQQMFV